MNKENERFINNNKWQEHKKDLINAILEKQTSGELTREQLEEMENFALEMILFNIQSQGD